jgi:uncharacterized membrane protein
MKRLALLMVAVLTLVAPAYAQLQFSSLDFPGASLTTARGINNRGDIVGAYRIVPPRHAYLRRGGQFMPLAPNSVLGTDLSEARKTNNLGDVVGSYVDSNGNSHGFLLRNGLVMTLDFPNANDTFAWGVNDLGTVVGFWDVVDANGNLLANHGFVWNNGVFAQVDFPGAVDTIVFGINNAGDLVGNWDSGLNSVNSHGFVCSKGQCFSFDVPFAGATVTQADDISANGYIVGTWGDASGALHGFLAVGSNFTSFDFPQATATLAWGINAAGQIVGNYFSSDGAEHGFLATPKQM